MSAHPRPAELHCAHSAIAASRRPVLVGLIGPPGAGKSTLARHLTGGVGRQLSDRDGEARGNAGSGCGVVANDRLRVFRLREFVHQYRWSQRDPQGAQRDEARTSEAVEDRLGWLPEHTVDLLLHAAVDAGQIGMAGVTVLEGFPGSRPQVRLLDRLAQEVDAEAALLELAVSDDIAFTRIQGRRVCVTCEPDRGGDPHRPAEPDCGDPARCAACGGQLSRRPSDESPVLTVRRHRYRERLPGIRALAADLGLLRLVIDATGSSEAVLDRVVTVLGHQSHSTHK